MTGNFDAQSASEAMTPVIRTDSFYQTTVEENLDSYSDTLLSLVADYRNGGAPAGFNCQSMIGKSKRGEVALRLFAVIDAAERRIVRAGFKTRGCLAITGCASALCTLIEGKRFDDVLSLEPEDVESAVGGLPSDKKYTARFAVEAARGLVGHAMADNGTTADEIRGRLGCDPLSVPCLMCEHCSLREGLIELDADEKIALPEHIEEPCASVSGDNRPGILDQSASFVRESSRNGVLVSAAMLKESMAITDEQCFEFYGAVSNALDDYCDINIIEGEIDVYFYSSDYMADAYARWCFLALQNDDVATLCACARDESRIYPRPLLARSLTNDPFAMSLERIEQAWTLAKGSGVGSDLERVEASNGDVYFYSTKFMTLAHAKALAEWRSVERLVNM